jgi:TP901 family phage tail tape measure protein
MWETASDDFMKFAKINGTDVNTSVQLVSRAMGDAGIRSDDYKSVLDQLTVASQKSGISIDTLTTNLAKYGAPMRALGLDTETSIAMFSGWEKAGVNTEIAFSGMKKAISTWAAEGKDSRVEFQKTLEEIQNAPDIATATTEAIQVFGQKAGPDLADAIQGGRFEVQDYVDALKNSQGAVESTYAGIADGTDDAKIAMNAAKVAASELGGVILQTLAPVLQKVAAVAKSVAEKVGSMDDGTKKVILTVAAVVAAVAPALLIAGKIANGISNITKAMAMAKSATLAETASQTSWNAALLTSPVTWIVVGIVALIAAVVLLYKNCKPFHDWVVKALNTVKNLAKTVFNGLITFFTSTIPKAWNSLVSFFKGIPAWWSNLWTQVGQLFKNLWNGIISFFTTTIPKWVNSFIQWIQKLPYNLGAAIGTMLGYLVKFGVDAWNWVTTKLPQIIKSILQWFGQLPGKIWTYLTDIVTKLGRWSANMIKKAVVEIPKFIGKVVSFFGELPGKIWTFLADVVNKVIQWAANLVTTATTEIPKFVSTVAGFMEELPKKMLDIGVNIVKGIWQGINSTIDWLHDMIRSFCQGIINSFKAVLHIHSPSALFADVIGKNLALGIGQGFTENMKAVAASMTAAIPTTWDTGVQVRTAYAAAYGGTSAAGSLQQTAASTSVASAPVFQQTVNNYSPKALSPAEGARLTRNATKQLIRSLKG